SRTYSCGLPRGTFPDLSPTPRLALVRVTLLDHLGAVKRELLAIGLVIDQSSHLALPILATVASQQAYAFVCEANVIGSWRRDERDPARRVLHALQARLGLVELRIA